MGVCGCGRLCVLCNKHFGFSTVWLDLRTASTVKRLIDKAPQKSKDYLRVCGSEWKQHNPQYRFMAGRFWPPPERFLQIIALSVQDYRRCACLMFSFSSVSSLCLSIFSVVKQLSTLLVVCACEMGVGGGGNFDILHFCALPSALLILPLCT